MKQKMASQLKRFAIVMRSKVNLMATAIKISEWFLFMFLEGEKLRDIKSKCLVIYGNYLHREKEIDKAITCYSKAVNLNPNNFYAHGGLTWAFIQKHMFQEAQEYCTKAINLRNSKGILSPTTVLIKLHQIIIYESLGQNTLANETIEQIQPFFDNSLAAIHDRLGRTYFEVGMFRQAEDHGKRAIDIDPDSARLYHNLARVYWAQSNYEMARIELQKVLQLTNEKFYKDNAIKYIEKIEKKMRAKG